MNIAIVDDLKNDRDILKNCIKNYFNNTTEKADIFMFSSGEEFISTFKPGMYEILFLDIYMKKITGIETAKKVFAVDENVMIVFLTTSNSFASESYDVNAVSYLIKPVNVNKLESVLGRCRDEIKKRDVSLKIEINRIPIEIKFCDIMFIDIVSTKLVIHLKQKDIVSAVRFYSVSEQLVKDKRFIESYKGVIVNMDHVVRIEDDDFIMDNGDRVPIRKRGRKEIERKYMQYIFSDI